MLKIQVQIRKRIKDEFSMLVIVSDCLRVNGVCALSEGSVLVLFELVFRGVLDSQTVQEQLVSGLQQADGSDDGLVIDIDSVQVTGDVLKTYRWIVSKHLHVTL